MSSKTLYCRSCNLYVREKTADWLDTFEWSAFCTFTHHRRMTLKSARRKMQELKDTLTILYGRDIMLFWVAEPFHETNSYHIHALVKIPTSPAGLETSILTSWHKVAPPAGYKKHSLATVARYEPGRGAHYYVGKYLQSDNVDWDILY